MTDSSLKFSFLIKEYEVLKDLYMGAENGTQSIFNFYLTFISFCSGGLLIISQAFSGRLDIRNIATILLVVVTIVGIFYIGTMSERYANLSRYGNAIDEIRRFIIKEYDIDVPDIYKYLTKKSYKDLSTLNEFFPHSLSWAINFYPTGTYQLFISFINSLSLSICYYINNINDIYMSIFVLVITFLLSNLISRIIKRIRMAQKLLIDVHR